MIGARATVSKARFGALEDAAFPAGAGAASVLAFEEASGGLGEIDDAGRSGLPFPLERILQRFPQSFLGNGRFTANTAPLAGKTPQTGPKPRQERTKPPDRLQEPRAQVEIRQAVKAQEIARDQNQRRADSAEVAQETAVEEQPRRSAGAGGVQVQAQPFRPARLRAGQPARQPVQGIQISGPIQPGRADQKQRRRPGPTPEQIPKLLDEERKRSAEQENRDQERPAAEEGKQPVGQVRPRRPDPVVRRLIRRGANRGQVVLVERIERGQQKRRRACQQDSRQFRPPRLGLLGFGLSAACHLDSL